MWKFHIGLKVKCEECDKLFSRNDKINNHMKLVLTFQPFACPFCDTKELKTKSYLEKHIKRNLEAFKISKEDVIKVNKEKKWKVIKCY